MRLACEYGWSNGRSAQRVKWLLTLRVDTARDGTGAFSTIDPERDYVVYGDASYQEDGSPSRFPLYLRLKSEEAEVLICDFTAAIDTQLVDLSREVTGLRVVHQTETHRVMAFAAKTTQRYVEDRSFSRQRVRCLMMCAGLKTGSSCRLEAGAEVAPPAPVNAVALQIEAEVRA